MSETAKALWIGKTKIFSIEDKGFCFNLLFCSLCGNLFNSLEGNMGKIKPCPNCKQDLEIPFEITK